MDSDEMAVVSIMRIGGGQVLSVIVCSGCGGAVRVAHKRTLKFIGNYANLIAAHVQQNIDSSVDTDGIGRGDEFAIRCEPHLVRTGDDPLGVGCRDVPAEPEDAGTQFGGGVNLA